MYLAFADCLLRARHWTYGSSFNHQNNSTRAVDWPKTILDDRAPYDPLVFSLHTLSLASHP